MMQASSFIMDERLTSSCFELGDWPLSKVLLKNNADYPWFILVPRIQQIQDLDDLDKTLRYQLMDEISQLSLILKTHFKPHKLNVGTLGNIVTQLHVHVVARFKEDPLWPHGIWQAAQSAKPYEADSLQNLLNHLRPQISQFKLT